MGAADGSHGQTWQLARAAVFYRPFVDDVNFPSCFSLLSLFGEALALWTRLSSVLSSALDSSNARLESFKYVV